MAPPRPIPATAFGFVIDDSLRRRWAQDTLDKHRGSPELKPFRKDPEGLLHSAMLMMISDIPENVYDAVPDLPRLHHYLLPVKEAGVLVPRLYVFVLQEDKRASPPTPEDIELVRKVLGLGDDQKPKWVPINREMC